MVDVGPDLGLGNEDALFAGIDFGHETRIELAGRIEVELGISDARG